MSSTSPCKKHLALITGANKETAYNIARLLGKEHGMIVLAGTSDEQSGRTVAARLVAQGIDVRPIKLDVTDPASIKAAARWIDETFVGCLDVLINHADRVLDDTRPGHQEPGTFKATFDANVRSPLRASRAMLPLLKRSVAGRIVNVSSSLGSLTQDDDPLREVAPYRVLCYNSSRAALHMQTVLFAAKLARIGASIKVNAIDFGYAEDEPSSAQGADVIERGVRAVVRLATLPADGPSGCVFNSERSVRF